MIGADALGKGGIGIAGNELDRSVVARHSDLLRAFKCAAKNTT